jgi:hypothetical protein
MATQLVASRVVLSSVELVRNDFVFIECNCRKDKIFSHRLSPALPEFEKLSFKAAFEMRAHH